MPVKVLTDHKGLEYFMTTKKLTSRQARWAEFLSEFNFVVTYQTGKKNDKADALTRKSNERPANEEVEQQKYRMQVLLPPERVELQPIEVSKPRDESPNEPPNKPQPAKKTVKAEKVEELRKSHAAKPHAKNEKVDKSVVATCDEKMKLDSREESVEDLATLPN